MGFKQKLMIVAGAALFCGISPVLADSQGSAAWTPAGAAAAADSGAQMAADTWTPAGAAPVAVASTDSTRMADWVPAGAAPGAAATDVAMQDEAAPTPNRVADLAP